MMHADYPARIAALMNELGIPQHIVVERNLPLFPEAEVLVETASTSSNSTPFLLEPDTAATWHHMQQAVHEDGIALVLLSAFRSLVYQAAIIRRKLQQGISLEEILYVRAVPGYREHHSGCAVDIGAPESLNLEAAFERTPAFQWLSQHDPGHGFAMSYPRNNKYGFAYPGARGLTGNLKAHFCKEQYHESFP